MTDLAIVRARRPSTLPGPDEQPPARLPIGRLWILLAAGAFVALTIFVGFALARHSGLAAGTVLDSAAHRTRLALTHAPKGLGTFPLVLLQFVGMSLTGWVIAARLRLPFRGSLETVLVSAGLGLVAFIPWALLLGATLGLTAPAVGLTFAAFDAVGVLVLLRTAPQALHWLRAPGQRGHISRADVVRRLRTKRWLLTAALTIIVAIVLYQVLLGALVPEVANDARWYHLGVPAHWVSGGRIDNSVANNSMAITGGPFYQEILYMPFLAAFGQIGAKLVNFFQLLLVCLTTFALARRITRSRDAGLCAVLVLLAIPLVTWEGTSAENDLGIACLTAISIYAFLRWTDDLEHPSWLWAAFACGTAAAGMKFFGIASIVFLLLGSLWVLRRQDREADLASFGRRILRTYAVPALIVLAVGLPGLLRSTIMTGDPFFPTLTRVFPSPYWNAGNSAAVHVLPGNFFPRVLLDVVRVPWRDLVAQPHGENKHAHQWGPLLILFLPLLLGALAFRRNRKGDLGFIFVAIAVTLAVWYPLGPGAPTRYVLPSAPLLAVAVVVVLQRALGSTATRPLAWCAVPVLALTVVVGQPFLNGVLPGLDGNGRIQGATYYNDAYLFGSAKVDDVQLRWMPAARYINSHLPASARIWDEYSLLPVYLYVKPELFSGYMYDSPHAGRKWDICSQDAAYWLRKKRIDYVAVPAHLRRNFAASMLRTRSTQLYSDASLTLYRVDTSGANRPLPFQQRVLCQGGHATSD